MNNLIKYKKFNTNEKYHINDDVGKITSLLYNKIYKLIPKLIKEKNIIIDNFLQNNFINKKFINDSIIIKLSKNSHGALIGVIIEDDIIKNLKLEFSINLSDREIIQQKLINNKLRQDINHELHHVIEFYHSGDNLSKSWDFDKRLKIHKNKFNEYEKWIDACYLFYLSEDHELRSRVSQTIELLKNEDDLYKKMDYLSKLNFKTLYDKMYLIYKEDFTIILEDFVKNVLLRKGNVNSIFNSYILTINKKSKKYKNNMLKLLYYKNNPDSLEENIENLIDYTEYILDDRIEKRDEKLNKLL